MKTLEKATETTPKVSVIIPTYNRAGYLKPAINSVLAQTHQNWELIVVDDGSTDETGEVVGQYCNGNRRIRYIRQPNGGASAARNCGIRAARGNLIAFLDDDDRWETEKLDIQCRFLDEHPEIGWVYSFMTIVNGADGTREVRGRVVGSFREMFRGYFVGPQTVMVRKDCFEQVGLFNVAPQIQGCEDTDIFLRLAKHCSFACVAKPLTTRHLHGANTSSRRHAVYLEALIEVYRGVDLRGQNQVSWIDRVRKVARLHHQAAYFYQDHGVCRRAAYHFRRALCLYPPIGLYLSPGSPRGLEAFRKGLEPYMRLGACAVRGLRNNVRLDDGRQ